MPNIFRRNDDVKEEEPVNEESVDTGTQEEDVDTQEETPEPEPQTDVGEPSVDALDEAGVPFKNRAAEWKRKYEELTDRMPDLAKEAAREVINSQEQSNEPDRSQRIEQLRAYANENPDLAYQVHGEISRLEKEDLRETIRNELQESREQDKQLNQAESLKKQSLEYVQRAYPEVFKKDSQGRFVGWNNSNQLTQQIAQVMRDDRFKNDPQGLMAAADIAYARYSRNQVPKQRQKEQDLKAEVKNAQKKTMTEGGGRAAQPARPITTALNRAKQTGRMQDAKEAMKEIFRAQGVIE